MFFFLTLFCIFVFIVTLLALIKEALTAQRRRFLYGYGLLLILLVVFLTAVLNAEESLYHQQLNYSIIELYNNRQILENALDARETPGMQLGDQQTKKLLRDLFAAEVLGQDYVVIIYAYLYFL
ncbi:MAG: hypothetical protein WC838_06910, partial [Candidatus Margulisiibacteriota bacterium]